MPILNAVSQDPLVPLEGDSVSLWKRLLSLWWVVPLVGLSVLFLDLYHDFIHNQQLTTDIVNTDVIGLILVTFGFLLGFYWQRITNESSALKNLTIQHRFSVRLSSAKDWDEILAVVSEFVASFLKLSTADLFIQNGGEYRQVSAWVNDRLIGENYSEAGENNFCEPCLSGKFMLENPQTCLTQDDFKLTRGQNSYCLPLIINEDLVGILRISLARQEILRTQQTELLKILIPYLATVVRVTNQRQSLLELSIANERRSLTHDLHDTLGQNLSYLRLTLDQMVRKGKQQQTEKFQKDLDHMLMVAAESCELVQETLIILDPDESPPLGKILREYSEIVGDRSDLEIEFTRKGKPIYLPQQISRQVFFLYREALSNIEKHAAASRVSVILEWTGRELEIAIRDNGRGFDPEVDPLDGHYGVRSMRQRVANLGGEIKISSILGGGTQLLIRLPVENPLYLEST